MKRTISIIAPAYNEEDNIEIFVQHIIQEMEALNQYDFEIIIVDDGSTDNTLNILKQLTEKYSFVYYLSFSRNFGYQIAMKAGFDSVNGDAAITMDIDLQHPPTLIPDMIKLWENGTEVVLTLREGTEKISWFKKLTSKVYYKLLKVIGNINIEAGVTDFRLLDNKVLKYIKKISEKDIYLKSIVSFFCFKTEKLSFFAGERQHGETKFHLKKMMKLGVDGIISSTIRPLYFSIYMGVIFSFLSLLYIPYVLHCFLNGNTVPGWASIIVSIAFFGGLQLFILGIIGLYLGKLYMHAKNRPLYVVSDSNIDNSGNPNI